MAKKTLSFKDFTLDEARSTASDTAAKVGAYNGGKPGGTKGNADLAHKLKGPALAKHRAKAAAAYDAELKKARSANAAKRNEDTDLDEEAEEVSEKGKGLWYNINKKKKAGKTMRKPGDKGAPSEDDLERSQVKENEELEERIQNPYSKFDERKLKKYIDAFQTNVGQVQNRMPSKPTASDKKELKDLQIKLDYARSALKDMNESTGLVSYHDMAQQVHDGEDLDEVLNIAQRRKAAINLKKNKAKIAMGRKRASKKIADLPRLKKRAQKAARTELAKKLTKGIPKSELTPARRAEIEKRLGKMKGKIDRIAKKSLPQVRRDEIAKKRGTPGQDK